MTLSAQRKQEHARYTEAYKGVYGMGKARRLAAYDAIDRVDVGSLLDVGCGRGEVLAYAREKGFSPVQGVDVVEELFNDFVQFGEVYNLPFEDDAFEVVTCFDVIEHLLPEDTVKALQELNRVSRGTLILCAANYESYDRSGRELHINKRPYKEWDVLINEHIDGNAVWLPKFKRTHSETWIITKE